MISIRKLAILLVAAGSVMSAQAQTGSNDAARRLRNREEVMARHQEIDRTRARTVATLTPAGWHRHHHRHIVRHRHASRHHRIR